MKAYKDKLNSINIVSHDIKTISELKQIMRTINNYDFNACRIDDFKQYKVAINRNKLIASGLKNNGIVSVRYFDTEILELKGA